MGEVEVETENPICRWDGGQGWGEAEIESLILWLVVLELLAFMDSSFLFGFMICHFLFCFLLYFLCLISS